MDLLDVLMQMAREAGDAGWAAWTTYRADVELPRAADLLAALWVLVSAWCWRMLRPARPPGLSTTHADRALRRFAIGMTTLARAGLVLALALLVGDVYTLALLRGTWVGTPFQPELFGVWGAMVLLLLLAPMVGASGRRLATPPDGGLATRARRRVSAVFALGLAAASAGSVLAVQADLHQMAAETTIAQIASWAG